MANLVGYFLSELVLGVELLAGSDFVSDLDSRFESLFESLFDSLFESFLDSPLESFLEEGPGLPFPELRA
jgi:hypothetical protein